MLRKERLNYILHKLNTEGKISSLELSRELGVSDDTIRRDINELASEEKLEKVHGGALNKVNHPLEFTERIGFKKDEKIKIAEKAVKLIEENQVIILDGGTTTYFIAKLIPNDFCGTIFTNSIPIAFELLRCPNINLYCLGGKVEISAQITTGYSLMKELSMIRADLAFLGVCSVDINAGVRSSDKEEALVKQQIVSSSEIVVAPITSDKLGVIDYFKFCEAEDIDYMVTEMEPTDKIIEAYSQKIKNIL